MFSGVTNKKKIRDFTRSNKGQRVWGPIHIRNHIHWAGENGSADQNGSDALPVAFTTVMENDKCEALEQLVEILVMVRELSTCPTQDGRQTCRWQCEHSNSYSCVSSTNGFGGNSLRTPGSLELGFSRRTGARWISA